jgi:hypothetical protein
MLTERPPDETVPGARRFPRRTSDDIPAITPGLPDTPAAAGWPLTVWMPGGPADGLANRVDLVMPPPSGTEPGVKPSLTRRHRKRVVENDEYAAFIRRVLRAYARRVGHGDIDAITDMATVAQEVETAMRQAVKGLRSLGYSWAEIAVRLGVTRQAAQQRWGSRGNE